MIKRNLFVLTTIFHFIFILGAVSALWSQSQLKLIQPDLVRQGEAFTGVVVEQTASGDVPLDSGQVVFQGQVVPIEPGGRIKLPAFVKETGDAFVVAQVIRTTAGAPSTVTQHVEVVPVAANVPTQIAKASPILNPGGDVWATGQRLNVVKAALLDPSGTQYDLGTPFGSSLQVGCTIPKNLPPGTYRFVAWDATGNRYEAPNQSKYPTLKLEGQRITHRGQRGQITVLSDTDGTVLLSGGEPQIVLDQKTISVHANHPEHLRFTAQQVGGYKVHVELVTPESSSVPNASQVDTKLEPVKIHYDPSRNQTQASIGVQALDEAGQPVANAAVDIAVSHPNGVEYGRAVTDKQGHASLTQAFAGQLGADALSAYAYRVPGHLWRQQADCDCVDLTVKFDPNHKFKDNKGVEHQGIGAKVSKDPKKKDTVNVELAVAYLAELTCEDMNARGECEGQIDVEMKSQWIHKPDEGVALGQQLGAGAGKEFGVDPKAWSTIAPDTESWQPKQQKVRAKCDGKKHTLNGTVVYTASFSAGNTNIRGKVTITLTPICKEKKGKPWKMTVFVDGTNKNGFDPDKSDYDGDGVDNAHDKFPMDPDKQ